MRSLGAEIKADYKAGKVSKYGIVAQLAERALGKRKVVSSNLTITSNYERRCSYGKNVFDVRFKWRG